MFHVGTYVEYIYGVNVAGFSGDENGPGLIASAVREMLRYCRLFVYIVKFFNPFLESQCENKCCTRVQGGLRARLRARYGGKAVGGGAGKVLI